METIQLLEQIVRMQDVQTMQAQTIGNMTKTLELACRRIVDLELAMQRADGIVKQNVNDIEEILGNTVLPKNKTKGRVIPISLVARETARDM